MTLRDRDLEPSATDYERWDVRAPQAPPVDGLAEAVVLHHCVYDPSIIEQVDLGPLLAFPEHREIWRVMKVTRQRYHGDPAGFLVEWWFDLSHAHPDRWYLYDDLLTSVAERESFRAFQQYRDGYGDQPFTTFLHDVDWWIARVREVAEARRAIQVLQHTAERLWRVPDGTTRAALAALRRELPTSAIRVEL
jgi:hypothetical protein